MPTKLHKAEKLWRYNNIASSVNMLENKKIAIMITSCDAYKDCWKPMICSFEKYWPDREWPVYIVTNYEEDDIPNVTFIKVGDDKHCWCNLAHMGLDVIGADYIIFFQEDYWLKKRVDNSAIKAHMKHVLDNDLDYLKIEEDMPRDKYRIGNSDYSENKPNIRYSINTAIAIWKVATMKPLMMDGWNGWYYERNIIPYIKEHHIQLKSETLHSSVVNEKGIWTIQNGAIVRGVWTYPAVEFLKDNNMEYLISQRPIMGKLTNFLYTKRLGHKYINWGLIWVLKKIKKNW